MPVAKCCTHGHHNFCYWFHYLQVNGPACLPNLFELRKKGYLWLVIMCPPGWWCHNRTKKFTKVSDTCEQGSGSVTFWYPDPYFGPGFQIRIWIGSVFNRASGSGSVFGIRIWVRIRIQEGKNDPQKEKKFMFWNVGWPLLWAVGFFCNLDILYGGLGIGKLQFLILKKI